MAAYEIFLPLTKVDLDLRLVHGVVTAEQPDRAGEICDYDSTKPYFEAWSKQASEATNGRSLGAVRAMHGRIAAGKLTGIAFDDDNKRILVSAKIVDDDEWRKVQEGVYTWRRGIAPTIKLPSTAVVPPAPASCSIRQANVRKPDAHRLYGHAPICGSGA